MPMHMNQAKDSESHYEKSPVQIKHWYSHNMHNHYTVSRSVGLSYLRLNLLIAMRSYSEYIFVVFFVVLFLFRIIFNLSWFGFMQESSSNEKFKLIFGNIKTIFSSISLTLSKISSSFFFSFNCFPSP